MNLFSYLITFESKNVLFFFNHVKLSFVVSSQTKALKDLWLMLIQNFQEKEIFYARLIRFKSAKC